MVKWLRHHPFTVVSWVRIPLGSPKNPRAFCAGYFFTLLKKCTLFRTIRNIISTIDGQEIPEEENIYMLNGRYYIQTIDDIFFFTKIEDWLCPLNNYVKAPGLAGTNSPHSYISRQEQSEIGNKVYANRPNIFSFWLNSILNLCKSNIKRSRFFVCSFCFLVSIISPWTHKRRRFLCLIVCTLLFQRLSPTKHAPHKETRPSENRIHSMFSFPFSP